MIGAKEAEVQRVIKWTYNTLQTFGSNRSIDHDFDVSLIIYEQDFVLQNPLVRSFHYDSRQPKYSFCMFYYCFCSFYDTPLPTDNEYFKNYNAWVNRGPFEAAPLLTLHLFRGGKVCQLFSQASIWKNNQKIVSPLIGFAHIWHSVFQVYILSNSLCSIY